jgi:hypothetical protein
METLNGIQLGIYCSFITNMSTEYKQAHDELQLACTCTVGVTERVDGDI